MLFSIMLSTGLFAQDTPNILVIFGDDIGNGDFVLSPSIDIDFVRNNDALVWGLNFGYSF